MQLIPASASTAATAQALTQPLRPASLSGHAAARAAEDRSGLGADFNARMLNAAVELDMEALQQPVAGQEMLPPAPAEPVAQASGDEVAEQGPVEQWLLGMLDQQQVQVQAREAAVHPGWPVAPQQAAAEAEGEAEGEAAGVAEARLQGQVPLWPLELSGRQTADPITDRPMPAALAIRPVVEPGAALNLLAAGAAARDPGAELPERLVELGGIDEGSQSAALLIERPAGGVTQGAERLLRLQGPEAKWGEQMLHALREHVEIQLQQRQQSASIRLDPPELGSLEIHLSHESGRLSVQLSAANADVARLLQQTSDRLRQELVAQHFVQVNVQVGADGQSGRQDRPQQLPDSDEVLAAAAGSAGAPAALADGKRSAGRGSDVLVTV
ncbi:flagellar hook-length control protein FliK [Pseudomonas songnenensis]|uniref:Flagellar hook-length control protein FliK n=1 Tax=Pseudomonas songnenensis TaxID=1176259 RepID=A0ABX9UV26_9PSED|nr:flagellar hook-length control protein FliK [Pseudomonas songnenensis]